MKDELLEIYEKISSLEDLNPSEYNNHLFSHLVSLVVNPGIKSNLNKSQIKSLRKICSEAEFYLERFWAEKIISSEDCWKELRNFPYYENYLQLTNLEWFALKGCKIHKNHKKVTFIGGGPLPLTAVILAKMHKCNVVVLEKNSEACKISKEVVKLLGLSEKIKIVLCAGEKYKEYNKSEIIILASLAGNSSKSKIKILKQIESFSADAHVLVRSSYGKREILYSPFNCRSFGNMERLMEIRPFNNIINSLIILRNKKINLIKPPSINTEC